MAFSGFHMHNFFIALIVVVLSSVVFSLGGLINAIYANKFDDISIIPTFVLTPLIYLGGVFYSIDLLPDFWKTVSHFNPIFYMVDAFRYGILGISDVNIMYAILMLLMFVLGLGSFALVLLGQGTGLRN
jgi:ABC-2 type transport system permease protein